MAEIDEVQFPTDISKGSSGGPVRRTSITELGNGFEERNTPLADSIHKYDAGLGLRSLDDLHDVKEFFEARMGQLYGFRWKDWGDYKSCRPSETPSAADQTIGVGDGATAVFQLTKDYTSGLRTYNRIITKPVSGTVHIAVDGVEQVEGADYTLEYTTGRLALGALPSEGAEVTSGFEFDVPARFDGDMLDISVSAFQAGAIPSVEILELKTSQPSDTSEIESLALWLWLQAVNIDTATNTHWSNTWSTP